MDYTGVAKAKTIVVDPGGGMQYTSIQAAIDDAYPGDYIRVYAGTFNENLNIDKELTLFGDDVQRTIVDGSGTGNTILITADNVSIRQFTVINSGSGTSNAGIRINNAKNCNISNNNVSFNNKDGIRLYQSSEIKLHNNIVSSNDRYGIYLDESTFNSIEGNSVLLNLYTGIELESSNDNFIINNKASGTVGYSDFFDDYGEGISISYSHRCTIKDNTILSNYFNGIKLYNSGQNIISNNIISNNGEGSFWYSNGGIYVKRSNSNTIDNNTITDNINDGIYISSSNNNKFLNNTVSDNEAGFFYDGGGFSIWDSNGNNLENNTVSNHDYGIYISDSDSNVVKNNICSNSEIYGITISSSMTNTIINNTMIGDSINLFGDELEYWNTHNISTSNTVNGKPVIYWADRIGGTVPPDVGQVILANCLNIKTENQHFSNCSIGILMAFTSRCNFANNTVYNAMYGINVKRSDNNSFNNNFVSNNRDDGFYITMSKDNTFKKNNVSLNDRNGIILIDGSDNNEFIDNAVYMNNNGFLFFNTSMNNLENNIVSTNNLGIIIQVSQDFSLTNNKCSKNNFGFYLDSSLNIRFTNNVMIKDGIYINGNMIEHWNTHDIDTSNVVNGKVVTYWKDKVGGHVISKSGQIILANCTGVTVESQDIRDTSEGISLGFSSGNTLKNNIISSNNENGIRLLNSNFNTILNNTISECEENGIYIDGGTNNSLESNYLSNKNKNAIFLLNSINNTINGNTIWENRKYGIYLEGSSGNTLNNNIVTANDNNGIYIYYSNNNIINKNSFSSNKKSGIFGRHTQDNTIMNNNASENMYYGIFLDGLSNGNIVKNNIVSENNYYGFYVYASNHNNFSRNTVILNNYDGFYIVDSYNNTIMNNTFSQNRDGIFIFRCSVSRIDRNSILNNENGINLVSSHNNLFIENSIEQNSKIGFSIDLNSVNNIIYFNNFISNAQQVIDNGSNIWNSTNHKGNYWSDYNGLDNGKNSRVANDGIGDTKIPHLGLDNFPFMKPSGWRIIKIPVLKPQDYLSIDGNYELSWNTTSNITKYILQEANTTSFDEPSIVYSGLEKSFQFTEKDNGTYYYRVKAFRQGYVCDWSNIVNITVDQPPSAPTGLVVLNISHNAITIKWDPNPEPDIDGYHILIKYPNSGINAPFQPVQNVSAPNTQFTFSNLTELSTYQFVVVAFDKIPNNSTYSDIINVTTIMRPYPPVINNSITDFKIIEDSVDDSTINLYYWFSDANSDQLTFRCEGQENITVTIFQDNGTVILEPAPNWNGREILKFYAADDSNEIFDSVAITIIPVNDPPEAVEIIRPINGITIFEGMLTNFGGICNDPDLPYGDHLNFKWTSNISGKIGENKSLDDITLPVGEHLITFKVSDSVGESATDSINISVLPTLKRDFDQEGLGANVVSMVIVIIILIIIFIFLLFI